MNGIAVEDTRSFVIMGHTGSGKTTLVDALLFKLGVNDRQGSVDAGSSMADYTDEEKARKITIYAKPFSGAYKSAAGKSTQMVMVDTPGYADFGGQLILASRAVTAGLIAVDANAGVQVGSTRAWKQLVSAGLPRGVVITGLDRENANFGRTLEQIRTAFGPSCIPVMLPLPDHSGVADVLGGARGAEAEEFKGKLVELAAETDDSLIEKYLGGEALSAAEMESGLRAAVRAGKLVPLFVCLSLKGVGVTELLEGITRLFPSPADVPVPDAQGQAVDPAPTAPFVGFVWRSVNDPFVGQLTFLRICGGTLRSDSELLNAGKGQKERVAAFFLMNGKKQTPVTEAAAGDIVGLTKLKQTGLGDVLCAPGHKAEIPPFVFPSPVISLAVKAKTQADEDKIGVALSRLGEEDPTIRVERNTETRETVISGMGDVHIEVAVDRMKRRHNVEVLLTTPKVPYKETVTATGEGHYRHKKQSGGRGQYGEVYLKVMPRSPDDPEWFEDAIVGGVIPGNFMGSVEKGVADALTRGSLAGYPVINVKVSVYDGSYHEVDSSDISFKIAASRAFSDGMSKARPVLLEPIMTVRIAVPEAYMGDVSGDLSHKRGRILGMESREGMQVITAEVPQAELFRYCAELRSMTGGRGTFEMEFSRYEIVPSNIAQKVIAEAEKVKAEEA
jgi:elongation factor G